MMKIYKYRNKVYNLTGTDTTNGYKAEYFLKSDGTESLSTTGLWAITEYQEIPSGDTTLNITTNRNTNAALCFYDDTKTYISGQAYLNVAAQDVTIPAGAVYFRMSVKTDEMGSFSARLPIKWRETNGYKYTHDENLIDYTATDTNKGYVSGKYLNVTGTPTTPGGSTAWSVSEYIDVSGLTHLKILIPGNTASNPSICYYDVNKAFISGTAYSARVSFGEVIPDGAKYIRFSYSEFAQTDGWEVYDPIPDWRETDPHKYTSGSWD